LLRLLLLSGRRLRTGRERSSPLGEPCFFQHILRAILFRNSRLETALRQDRIPFVFAHQLSAAVPQVAIEGVLKILARSTGRGGAIGLLAALDRANFCQVLEMNFQPTGPHQLGTDEFWIQFANNRVGSPAVPEEAERQEDEQRRAEPPAAFPLEIGL